MKALGTTALLLLNLAALSATGIAQGPSAVALPEGVKAVWDLSKAYHESTPTRERVCINGLWQWQPAKESSDQPPAGNWGYFKVPAAWPAAARGGDQTLYPHPSWEKEKLQGVTTAWQQREIEIPKTWTGRRIVLSADYVNSRAAVYLDGKKAGDIWFPAGEVDLTALCKPGKKQTLSLWVAALPLSDVVQAFTDTAQAKTLKGAVARRGLCGDVFLVAAPKGPRIDDLKVDTSFRKGQITFNADLSDLAPDAKYALRAAITDKGKKVAEFTSKPFAAADLKEGRLSFSESWMPEKLWNVHTPENMYDVAVSLVEGDKVLDAGLPVHFGFREFWIDGRDFYLNGRRIYLSSVVLSSNQGGPWTATYEVAKETMKRLQEMFGINCVYTGNYDCMPGSNPSYSEILRAADDAGMLIAFTQPHFGHYDWKAADADEKNGYARHAAFFVRAAQNHPSVVFYTMSHNSTGYDEDMNPDHIDGDDAFAVKERGRSVSYLLALRAQAIVNRLDPSRIVYHHSSGSLGAMITNNFYTNWLPIQELCDWLEHWGTVGTKPFFTVEYDAPCPWDWTMYRGWYKGKRTYGGAKVPWEFCLAEWNAQMLGDQAYQISEKEKKNLRWEADKFKAGELWGRFQYPFHLDHQFDERFPVYAKYVTDVWRAWRTWGMSANSPTQGHAHYWKLRPGVDKSRKELKTDWEKLQRPGYSPDSYDPRESFELAFERSDWLPTLAGDAVLRNNLALLAYIAGKPSGFTEKGHNFLPGETVEKQLIVINNFRETVSCECQWSLGLPGTSGSKTMNIEAGQQERIPLKFELPAALPPGKYEIHATVQFANAPFKLHETQKDTFELNVLPKPAAPKADVKIALFDPKGETAKSLDAMGVKYQRVEAAADLSKFDVLVIGKGSLTLDGPGPNVARVRDGLKVVLFEQTGDVLEKRFGFRTAEYGLRNVFKRVPDHPLLAGIGLENLHDWRGEATVLPPRLKYKPLGRFYGAPGIKWCGIEVTRIWRCGNRGNVASALIEKPVRGDFLPIIDGGYALQYSPLMEYREGKGLVLFCQLDVTGRTEQDPAAETIARNVIEYAAGWKPAPRRQALYVGDPAGRRHLEYSGIAVKDYAGGKIEDGSVLVVGPSGGKKLAAEKAAVAEFLKAGGNLLTLGLDQDEANAFLPFKVEMKKAEHIAAYFEPAGAGTLLAGVSPADVHNRAPKEMPLVSGGAAIVGDGVLARAEKANVVFCQFPPFMVTRINGAAATLTVDDADAAEGKQSALLSLGAITGRGATLQQEIKPDKINVGKTYTFAAMVKALDEPVVARLEIERPASPWDRAAKSQNIPCKENEWTELHVTFKVEKPFQEGWLAYLACDQEAARLRVDGVRLYEGDYVPGKPGQPMTLPGGAANLLANAGFEDGVKGWKFTFDPQQNLRRTYRRTSCQLARLLGNMGVSGPTPLLSRFSSPVASAESEKRWLDAYYLDIPEEWDDPYRFFVW